MKRLHWTIAAIAIVAIAAAACSGGSSNLISMGPGQSHQYKVGYIHATLRGMPEAQKHAIDRIVARVLRSHHLNPKFLPGTTSEVDFNLVSVGGYPVVYPYGSEYSFKLFPPQAQGTNGCTPPLGGATPSPAPTGFTCTIEKAAPAAVDVYDVIACANTSTSCTTDVNAILLSESQVSITVLPGQMANATFSLNPVVGGLAFSAPNLPWQLGPNPPTWNPYGNNGAGVYTCNFGGTAVHVGDVHPHHALPGCYDPILDGSNNSVSGDPYYGLPATPQWDTVALQVLDQDHDVIIPASGGGSVYGYPIYLSTKGNVDNVTIACTDTHVQFLNGGASVPGIYPVLQSVLANGTNGASNAVINSPVTGHDNSANALGYDFTGTSTRIYGNNVTYVNFDGGSNLYSADQHETCTASDSANDAPPVTYYVGVGQGTISWNGNARRAPHHNAR